MNAKIEYYIKKQNELIEEAKIISRFLDSCDEMKKYNSSLVEFLKDDEVEKVQEFYHVLHEEMDEYHEKIDEFRDSCEHNETAYDGHDSHYNYEKCLECGKSIKC